MDFQGRLDCSVPPRVAELYFIYLETSSLRKTGERAKMSGERVRQLFAAHQLPTRAQSDMGIDPAKLLCVARRSASLKEAARNANVSEPTLVAHLRKMGADAALRRLWSYRQRKLCRKHYTDARLLEILRELAAKLGRSPVQRDLDTIEGVPAHKTYVMRFGSLRISRRLAGLADVGKGRVQVARPPLAAAPLLSAPAPAAAPTRFLSVPPRRIAKEKRETLHRRRLTHPLREMAPRKSA